MVTYRVTGRYMSGSEIVFYHLVGSDGSTLRVNKNKALLMISRGEIENMRAQYSGEEAIIRGKGTNLNKLPVFDLNKEQFRNQNAPQYGSTAKTSANSPLSQFRITKRVMYKTSCIGYEVTDAAGHANRLSRGKVAELAEKGYIINADAGYYTPNGAVNPILVVRGIGCALKSLPEIVVDHNGNVIENNVQRVYARAVQSKRAGILYNDTTNAKRTFGSGDYIVVLPNGNLNIMEQNLAKTSITLDSNGAKQNNIDLDKASNYSIEFFGNPRRKLSAKAVSGWPIVRITNPKIPA